MMRISKKLIINLVLTLTFVSLCTGQFDMIKYRQMPPLYFMDDYDVCLQQKTTTNNSYCMVYAEIQPLPESPIWQIIDEFNRNSTWTYYRHDQLYRGVCTSRCKNFAKTLNHEQLKDIEPISENMQKATQLYSLSRRQKTVAQYEQQMHSCLSNDMVKQYNLSVKTFVLYCDNPKEPIEKDLGYYLALLVLLTMLTFNLLSTIYDAILKMRQQNEKQCLDYYDTKHDNKVNHYLTSFSMFRNFRRLLKPNNTVVGKDLSFIDGFRTIMSFVIVFEHILLIQFFPIKNSEFIERLYSITLVQWLMHIMPCIEIFFVMTGLMLYIKFAKTVNITSNSSWVEVMWIYLRMMISRYLRYMPSLLILILFTTNIPLHILGGPFWRQGVEPNVIRCRTNWWSNLFMTANKHPDEICFMHTWYIAADFQLYGIFLAILIITAKYPQHKKFIYSIIFILGISIPSIISYIYNLKSILMFMLEDYRHHYFKGNYESIVVYMKSYTNLNGCFVGIMCGELYVHYLQYDKYKKIMGSYLKLAPPIGWAIIFSIWYLGTFIIFQETTIWISIFPVIHRHMSIVIVAVIVILRGMCTGGGFLTWPIFRLLARVSYQLYLWHPNLLFAIYFSYRKLLEVSFFETTFVHIIVYSLSVILATVMAISIEYPIAEILAVFDVKKKSNTFKKS